MKYAERMSYATILRDRKKRVNPDELRTTVQGIRETRSKDLQVQGTEGTGRLNSACIVAIGASGTVRHLIPWIEVES